MSAEASTIYMPHSENPYALPLYGEGDARPDASPYAGEIVLPFEAVTSGADGRDEVPVEPEKSWVKRHETALLLGAAAATTEASLIASPLGTVGETMPGIVGGMLALETAWIGGAAIMLASAANGTVDWKRLGQVAGQKTVALGKTTLRMLQHPSEAAEAYKGSKLRLALAGPDAASELVGLILESKPMQVMNDVHAGLTEHTNKKNIATWVSNSRSFKTGFWINTVAAVSQFAWPATIVITKLPPESLGLLTIPTADLGATIALRLKLMSAIKKYAKS